MATLTQDNRASSTLTLTNRTAVASLSQDNKAEYLFTWAMDLKTWAEETRTWAALISNITQDSRT